MDSQFVPNPFDPTINLSLWKPSQNSLAVFQASLRNAALRRRNRDKRTSNKMNLFGKLLSFASMIHWTFGFAENRILLVIPDYPRLNLQH